MAKVDRPIVKRSLFSWVFEGNVRWQVLLLAIIGAMVLMLALGVFLPLWNLGQAARGHGGG